METFENGNNPGFQATAQGLNNLEKFCIDNELFVVR